MSESRMEYSRDRLEARIRQLEAQILNMQVDYDAERSRVLVAEMLLCVCSGFIGYGLGIWLG